MFLLFPSNIDSAFFRLKPTPKLERPGSPEFSEKISDWDSNPRQSFHTGPNYPIRLVSVDYYNGLIGTAEKR